MTCIKAPQITTSCGASITRAFLAAQVKCRPPLLCNGVSCSVDSGCYVACGDDLPSVSDFEERYCGCWDSFEDYAYQFAEDICLMEGWPEEAKRYFNWDAWIRDQEVDYTIADAPDGGVFIYRSL